MYIIVAQLYLIPVLYILLLYLIVSIPQKLRKAKPIYYIYIEHNH